MHNLLSIVLIIALTGYFVETAILFRPSTTEEPFSVDSALMGEDSTDDQPVWTCASREPSVKGGWRGAGKWPSGIVVYTIDDSFTNAEKGVIFRAMEDLSSKTCIKFRERVQDGDFVNIVKKPGMGCYSYFGRKGGAQDLNLEAPGCVYKNVILHELAHVIGFVHEQSRPDRDDYVDVIFNNIKEDQKPNFKKYTKDEVETYGTPYDFDSITHYPPYAFAINESLPTIIAKQNQTINGQKKLSSIDIKEINLMYRGVCSKGE